MYIKSVVLQQVKLLILGMEWVSEYEDFQMFGFELNTLEFVDRGIARHNFKWAKN